jgi:hypothetical protein
MAKNYLSQVGGRPVKASTMSYGLTVAKPNITAEDEDLLPTSADS